MTTTTKESHHHGQVSSSSSSSMDLFLTGEERYQVWEVKAAERPYLLAVCDEEESNNSNNDAALLQSSSSSPHYNNEPCHTHQHENKVDDNNDNDNDNDNDSPCCSSTLLLLPWTDGCDIAGWRRAKIGCCGGKDMEIYYDAALGIGQGCALMRRETQLPMLSTKRAHTDWHLLQAKLLNVPTPTPQTPPPHDDDDDAEGTFAAAAAAAAAAVAANMLTMIPRISYKDPKNAVLHPWFERENVPVLLEGCMSNWPAMKTCTWDALVKEFGSGGIGDGNGDDDDDDDDYQWRFSDTHGETMSLKVYDKYTKSLEGLMDDSPLAVYDSQFHTDERQRLLQDYQVPTCFATDLFALLDQEDNGNEEEEEKDENENSTDVLAVERPPYRWILMGPERSGTGLHVDPVGTHAWVSLIQGCKRWVLFPPDTCRKTIGMQEEHPIPSVLWFRDYYDKVCGCLPTTTTTSDGCGPESTRNIGSSFVPGAVHVVQRPGETVYVPAGWPHLVLNLEASVAITENYATEYPSMNRLWKAVVEEAAEPALAVRFREALEKHRPDLAAQIHNDDNNDNNYNIATSIATTAENNNNKSCVSIMPTTSHGILMKTSCGEEEEGMNQSENEPNSAMVVVESLTSSRQLYYVGTTAAVDDKLFR